MSIREISVSGTYYGAGKALGMSGKKEAFCILDIFQKSKLYVKLQEFLDTSEGSELLTTFERVTEEHCADIVSELHGIADGADLDYRELFLLNLEPEWLALFSDVPDSGHDMKYASTADGCTNIYLPTAGNQQVYLGHTEDIDPGMRNCGLLVHHEIYKTTDSKNTSENTIEEAFTEYVLPGILAGSKFGFNNHGFIFAHNNIYQQGLNIAGVPRRFVLRSLIAWKNMHEVKTKLDSFPGIATGYTFNCLYKETRHGEEETIFCSLEIAGDQERGTQTLVVYPTRLYFHCNTFQHLSHLCHPEESSLRRARVLKRIISRDELSTHADLLKAISNQDDKEYPMYRTGASPDYLCTAAIGVFDSTGMKMMLYEDRPDICQGQEIDMMRYASR